MKPFKLFNILIVVILTVSYTASCQTKPESKVPFTQIFWDSLPKPIGYVNDFENIYTDSEEHLIDSILEYFDKKTTIQIAVITFDTTMTTRDSLDALTLRIGNAWGVGQKSKNNGIVIGISKGYRKIRIQNGYGIEAILSDKETKEIIDSGFIPSFRIDKYYEGTFNGIVLLIKVLEKNSGEKYKVTF